MYTHNMYEPPEIRFLQLATLLALYEKLRDCFYTTNVLSELDFEKERAPVVHNPVNQSCNFLLKVRRKQKRIC